MPKIFISYRRVDAGYVAHQVSEALKKRLGEHSVFIDIVEIERGAEFPTVIADALEQSDILVAIIGARWLDARFSAGPMQGQRRLDDPDDFVRREISTALGRDIPVLPVVIEGVRLSALAPNLPPELSSLVRKNEIPFRSGHDLEADLKQLVQAIKSILLPPLKYSDLLLPPGVVVAPQGLRSFGQHEKDFFIHLLPDLDPTDGLPKQLSFWKSRIEEKDATKTFRVGLIYGPSGCGKSSLVKAGLLPQLAPHVRLVYVEARPTDTEAELLGAMRQRFPQITNSSNQSMDLRGIFASRDWIPDGEKILIVLDQFEQYLHSTPDDEQEDLAEALRECDGENIQCILMIRDDFLTPITRFMQRLQIPLAGNQNMAMVDLFTKRHAKKVLALLGQGYGGLPILSKGTVLSRDHNAFLNQAITEMAEGDHVIPVRLALFAQMFKGKTWSTSILTAIGGTTGVGATFLEDSLASPTAPESHRRHQKAAQRILASLLPEQGTTIKGAMRTRKELLDLSGYSGNPDAFAELLTVLDKELRLVTPTETVAKLRDGQQTSEGESQQRYQLTHDYLVPALREWLARKQKETRKGRAELLLADRAAVWNGRPENRQLPSIFQWLRIRWFTDKKDWTPSEAKMMSKSSQYLATMAVAVTTSLGIALLLGLFLRGKVVEQQRKTYAAGLLQRLLDAETTRVPAIVDEMRTYRVWIDPLLQEVNKKVGLDSRQRLHTSLALLSVDTSQAEYLFTRLLNSEPEAIRPVQEMLVERKDDFSDRLWGVLEPPLQGKEEQALRAAAALARFSPNDKRWPKVSREVAELLAKVSPFFVNLWMDVFKPIERELVEPLCEFFVDANLQQFQRLSVANILADFAADKPQVLAELLMNSDEQQFPVIYPKFESQREIGLTLLEAEIDKTLPDELPSSDTRREILAKRQSNAGVALLKLNRPEKVWPLLKHRPDPRVRSYLIHRIGSLDVDADLIKKRLIDDGESDITIRRALLLCLGVYSEKKLPPSLPKALIPMVQDLYLVDPDPGIHAAAEWLLRIWKQTEWLDQTNQALATAKRQHESPIDITRRSTTNEKEQVHQQWYINGQGQTMVIIPGPVEFIMGSPTTEDGRKSDEAQHTKRISRSYALSSHLVTKEQFLRFNRDFDNKEMANTPEATCPMGGMIWHEAAEYCNWLSRLEGIDENQLCYEIKDHEVVKLKDNYLSLSSYRLPTEAEIEYATRAGAITSRCFGETEELLPMYAWYIWNSKDRPHPVGGLKPNDLGLFDAHGNLWTWCQNSSAGQPVGDTSKISEDREEDVVAQKTRGLRGGSFVALPSSLRSATCNQIEPGSRFTRYGIRLARTIHAVKP